jgi:hypothetical protein
MSDTTDDMEMWSGLYDSYWADDEEPLFDGAYAAEGRLYSDRPCGPGECPECGAKTRLVTTGPHGPFYGCVKFPACRGSRQPGEEFEQKGIIHADRIKLPYCKRGKPSPAPRRSLLSKIAGAFKAGRGAREAGRGARRAD